MKQISFAEAEFGLKKKLTRREKFLAAMAQVVLWSRLIAVVEPFCPKIAKKGAGVFFTGIELAMQ